MKRRSESFFGLHFDFHATPDRALVPVGATLKEEEIRKICREVRPDFIQIDCKGHPGWASYPTACGNAMPEFQGDPLALWRRVTAEEGVALYMHYSGVWDAKYCAAHPDDTVLRADGSRSEYAARTLGRCADDLLIPQLSELALKYKVDGVWVDGDCWGTEADFHPDTLAAFEKATGIDLGGKLPANRGDEYYEEYREFCRELFRSHVRKYVNKVHRVAPDFQIASNWAYTDHMPEPVSADVDFISGDLNPWDSFDSARYAARAIAQQNRTWDLMSWNFRAQDNIIPCHVPKHPTQIMQEAAAVISLGGGFQNYITQYPEGAPRMDEIMPMKAVGEFARARERYCFRGRAVHQAAILLSTHDRHRESASLFSRNGCEKIMGLVSLFADAGQSTELVSEHTLEGNYDKYPLIALPELFEGLREDTVEKLLAYARNGGSLLLTGQNTCRIFEKATGAFTAAESGNGLFTCNGTEFGAVSSALTFEAASALTVAGFAPSHRDAKKPFAVVIPFGRGKLALVGANIGNAYFESAQYTYRKLISALCEKLYSPLAAIESALGLLELTALEKDGQLMLQLVNSNCNHGGKSHATWDMIPPVCNITLSVKAGEGTRFVLRPEGRELAARYENGRAYIEIDRVDIHSIVQVIG